MGLALVRNEIRASLQLLVNLQRWRGAVQLARSEGSGLSITASSPMFDRLRRNDRHGRDILRRHGRLRLSRHNVALDEDTVSGRHLCHNLLFGEGAMEASRCFGVSRRVGDDGDWLRH